MTEPMPKIPPGGVLLSQKAPKVTLTFRRDRVQANWDGWAQPMIVGTCHLSATGSIMIVLEPALPSGGGIPNSIVPPGLVG